MMGTSTFHTSPRRVALAFVLSAAIGTATTTALYLIGVYQANGPDHFAEWWLSKGVRFSLMSYPVWLGFILMFGGPAWLLLHLLKFRHWLAAAICGAVVSSVVMLAINTGMFSGRARGNFTYYSSGDLQWKDGVMTPFGWKMAFITAAEFGLLGALVALAMWAIAYKRERVR